MATSAGDAMPPPLQDIPTAKEKKYDRQLRLWGAAGQVALEETHILLINNGTGVTGVEALKNLVLPGIGQFTILDSAIVSEADLGVNFFLDDASLGKYRAVETVKLLMELNPSVQGHAITEPLETWITDKEDAASYNLIIVAAPIHPNLLVQIQSFAEKSQIPAFYLHSVGYFSSFALQLPPAFPIVDTHPDPETTTDLRLLKPWPELSRFAEEKTAGLEEGTINAHEKAHIPWVCILLHYLEKWKASHDGQLPTLYKDKTAFRDMVRAVEPNEENFDEACAAALRSLNLPEAPSSVREILSAPETQNLTADTPSFWLIAKAVSDFYTKHHQLPLPGSVPDMKAQSAEYVRLQSIYKAKARSDCAEVTETVRQLEHSTGRPSGSRVDSKEIESFCKGAAHIHLVRGRPWQMVQSKENGENSKLTKQTVCFGDRAKAMATNLTNPESLLCLHIAFLAWDDFVATHTSSAAGGQSLRIPGATLADREYDQDVQKVTGIAHYILDSLINEAETFIEEPEYTEVKDRVAAYCSELVRAGGGELHNIASLTGGLLAQEAIKVVTKQYVPIDNTVLFDGVASRTEVLKL